MSIGAAAVELRESYAVEERRDIKKSLQTLTETQANLVRTVDRMIESSARP